MFSAIRGYIIGTISFIGLALIYFFKSMKKDLEVKDEKIKNLNAKLKVQETKTKIDKVVNTFNNNVKIEKTKIEVEDEKLDVIEKNIKKQEAKNTKNNNIKQNDDFVEVEIWEF